MIQDLESLAAKLEIERQAITSLVMPLTAEDLDRPGADGAWSIRQTLAHVVGSEKALLALARSIAAGESPQRSGGYDLDAENARAVSRRNEMSVPDLLAQWQGYRQAWATFLESVTEEQLKRTGAHPGFDLQVSLLQLVIVMLKHERNHKQDIARQLQKG